MPDWRFRDYVSEQLISGTSKRWIVGYGWYTYYQNRTDEVLGDSYDIIGNWDSPNPLSLIKRHRVHSVLDGEWLWDDAEKKFLRKEQNWALTYDPYPPDPRLTFPKLSALAKNNAAWDILARANLSVPHFATPTFVGELKDVPELLRWVPTAWKAARTKSFGPFWASLKKLRRTIGYEPWKGLKIPAGAYLTYKWGVRPLVSDLQKMLDFTESLNKRLESLRQLQEIGYTSVRVSLGTQVERVKGSVLKTLESVPFVLHGYKDLKTTCHTWGSVKFVLDPTAVLPKFDHELLSMARKITFGITSYETLQAAWELLPWSWFIDWFWGVQTLLSANNNTIPTTSKDICLMRHSKSLVTYRIQMGDIPETVTLTGLHASTYERKEREEVFNVAPYTPPSIPVLLGRHWSILGSLAVLKLFK